MEGGGWQLWSGPDRESTLTLLIDRQTPAEATFRFCAFMRADLRETLMVTVDGRRRRATWLYVQQEDGSYVSDLTVIMPARRKDRSDPTQICFKVRDTVPTSEPSLAPATAYALLDTVRVSRLPLP
jgi:hypothetical protein